MSPSKSSACVWALECASTVECTSVMGWERGGRKLACPIARHEAPVCQCRHIFHMVIFIYGPSLKLQSVSRIGICETVLINLTSFHISRDGLLPTLPQPLSEACACIKVTRSRPDHNAVVQPDDIRVPQRLIDSSTPVQLMALSTFCRFSLPDDDEQKIFLNWVNSQRTHPSRRGRVRSSSV